MKNTYSIALADIVDLPAHDAKEVILLRWLREWLGRSPSWYEYLEFRSGLEERRRRQPWWAWWRRMREPRRPTRGDLITNFLSDWDGQYLLRSIGGSLKELQKLLAGPDPFYGYDGRHPYGQRQTQMERARERISRGGSVPTWLQLEAVLAYAEWKLDGAPVLERGFIPELVWYLSPRRAAAINALSPAAVAQILGRLTDPRFGRIEVKSIFSELDFVGARAMVLWPGIQRRGPEAPRGVWPTRSDTEDVAAGAVEPRLVPPPGFRA